MARRIDKLPPAYVTSRVARYPWDEWMDGHPWVILYGEDYRCAHKGMVSGIYRAARERGGCVQVRKLTEGKQQIGWAFQFIRFEQSAPLRRVS